MQYPEQLTGAQPLDQPQFDLRLLTHRGGEANLQGVVSPYSAGEVNAAYDPSETTQGSDPMLAERGSKGGYAPTLFTMSDTKCREHAST